jgi:iron-sulfur cluster repair protein YtfE (RIC family)
LLNDGIELYTNNEGDAVSEFIEELKREHAEIRDSLLQINNMDLFSAEARNRLMEVRELLVKHLQKEDQKMYPRLKEASSEDEHFQDILNYLEGEIKLISQFVFIFFDKYSKKSSPAGIEREFNLISSTLIKRIEKEEEFFFPKYERMSG